MTYRIRLRGPWQLEPCEPAPPGLLPDRVNLPRDWPRLREAGFQNAVSFRRHFHCPTNLEAHETVWLVVEQPQALLSVTLNDNLLGSAPSTTALWQAPVTELLNPRNELAIETVLLAAAPPWNEVRLEIRRFESAG